MKTLTFCFALICVNLTLWAQHKILGTYTNGGKYNAGVIFTTDSVGGNYGVTYDFSYSAGKTPEKYRLIEVGGKLFGMTSRGGSMNNGVLFEYDPVTNIYSSRVAFKNVLGFYPLGDLVLGPNGKLYGLTSRGGANDRGTIIEYDPVTHLCIKKYDLSGPVNTYQGSMLLGDDNKLYGLTEYRGTFSYDPITNIFTTLINSYGSSMGYTPEGTLLQAVNGKIYGVNKFDTLSGAGSIFELDINSNSLTYQVSLDVIGAVRPMEGLVEASNGKLYGTTKDGGANGMGCIYEFDSNTHTLSLLHSFSGDSCGKNPMGGLCEGLPGVLYGINSTSDITGNSVLYSYDIALDTVMVLHDMQTYGSGIHGTLKKASNGKMYGATRIGGVTNSGVIFEYDPLSNVFAKKLDFSASTNGYAPFHSGMLQYNNDKLYGFTGYGGANNSGVIYEYDPISDTYTVKKHLSVDQGSGWGSTFCEAYNGKLYGLARSGGIGWGTVLEYDPILDSITFVYKLPDGVPLAAVGARPYGALVQHSNGKLYGTTAYMAATQGDRLFEFDIQSHTLTTKITGIDNDASGSLIEAQNGKLYYQDNWGIEQYDPVTNTLSNVYDFPEPWHDGHMGLTDGKNGKLYGVREYGGSNNSGSLFEFDPMTLSFSIKVEFDSIKTTIGKWPTIQLALVNGKLIGGTSYGALHDRGSIFNYDIATGVITNTYSNIDSTGSNIDLEGLGNGYIADFFGSVLTDFCPGKLRIIGQTDNMKLCLTQDTFMYVKAVGSQLNYQWKKNGVTLIGQNNDTLFFNSIAAQDSGLYVCEVSNNCGMETTISKRIAVYDCSVVWPGDINEDLSVDGLDLISLGLAYGINGTPRDSISNMWIGHTSLDWGTDQMGGFDQKYADCNGDGTTGLDDTLAINLNYGSQHALRILEQNKVTATAVGFLNLIPAQQTYGYNEQVLVDVVLQDTWAPFPYKMTDFYGALFSFSYSNNSLIQLGSMSFSIDDSSWVGKINSDAIRLTKTFEPSQKIDGAICRTDLKNVTGSGKIGTIRFVTGNTDGVFNLTCTQVYRFDSLGNRLIPYTMPINIDIQSPVSLKNYSSISNISIYPNPNKGTFTINNLNVKDEYQLQVKDVLGRTVYVDVLKNTETANIKLDQVPGIYWIQLNSKRGSSVHKVIIE